MEADNKSQISLIKKTLGKNGKYYYYESLSAVDMNICQTLDTYFQADDNGNPIWGGGQDDNSEDLIFAAFDSSNKLVWSTFLGGERHEFTNASIKIVSNNENKRLYSVGYTWSPTPFPLPGSPMVTLDFPSEFPTSGVVGTTYFNEFATETPNGAIVRLEIFDDGISTKNENLTEEDENNMFEIFPNPNNGNFSIKINEFSDKEVTIRISDILGKTTFEKRVIPSQNEQFEVNLGDIPKGVYQINISQGKKVQTKKIILQ